jgi:hypothetical protein
MSHSNPKRLFALIVAVSTCAFCVSSKPASASDIDKLQSLAHQQKEAVHSFYVRQVITEESLKTTNVPESIKQLDQFQEVLTIANRKTNLRKEIWCDLNKKRWAIATTDMRDLTKLAEELGVQPADRPRLSQSATTLGGDMSYIIRWEKDMVPPYLVIYPTPDKMGITHNKVYWRELDIPTRGIVPHKHLVPGEATITIHILGHNQNGDAPNLVVQGSTHASKINYRVDPSLGYRYREVEYRSEKGVVTRRQQLSEFRQVGQFQYPFQIQEDVWDQDGHPVSHKTETIEEMTINIPIAPENLRISIPANVIIADFVNRQGEFKCRKPLEADLDDVFDAIAQARNTTSSSSPSPD